MREFYTAFLVVERNWLGDFRQWIRILLYKKEDNQEDDLVRYFHDEKLNMVRLQVNGVGFRIHSRKHGGTVGRQTHGVEIFHWIPVLDT